MSIRSIEESKIIKKYGCVLGREKIALRIIELCKEVAKEENYKNSIKAAGKIRVLAMACKFDDYWEEKMLDGYYHELRLAERELYNSDKIKEKEDSTFNG